MRAGRLLLAVLALGLAGPAAAQQATRRPRALAGVCGTANWVCVAECIDVSCVEGCLRQGCEEALERLERCTAKAGCGWEDTECAARECGPTCERAFEPAPRSLEKERVDPCAGLGAARGGRVPPEVVGRWALAAATLRPRPADALPLAEPEPRPDYERSLEVTAAGCFLLRTRLEDATLGRGNALEVRAWGHFTLAGEDAVALRTRDGQVVGKVCGQRRVIPLSRARFRWPRYTFRVEQDTLTLVEDTPARRTFQFQRVRP